MNNENILKILEKNNGTQGGLILVLEEIQTVCGYLPEDALRIVADRTDNSLVDIYGVATFYRAFSLKPRGKHIILVCLGTACHVRGAPKIVDGFEQQLGIKVGETTLDKEFTLEAVNCLGACALGPTVVVDGHYFSHVTLSKVKGIINKIIEGLDKIDIKTDKRVFPVEASCSLCNHSLTDPTYLIDGHPSICLTVSLDRKKGWLRLSSLYGSHNFASEHEIPPDSLSHYFCPYCSKELLSILNCPECGELMAAMSVCDGFTVHVCTRGGCKGHMLDLN